MSCKSLSVSGHDLFQEEMLVARSSQAFCPHRTALRAVQITSRRPIPFYTNHPGGLLNNTKLFRIMSCGIQSPFNLIVRWLNINISSFQIKPIQFHTFVRRTLLQHSYESKPSTPTIGTNYQTNTAHVTLFGENLP